MFKSRTLAADACKDGRVYRGEQALKASSEIRAGDLLVVHKEGFRLTIRVKALLEKRLGAQLAREYYENLTPEEELNKYKSWFIGKAGAEVRGRGAGRPTKKERREIDDYKDSSFDQEIEPWLEE